MREKKIQYENGDEDSEQGRESAYEIFFGVTTTKTDGLIHPIII